MHFGNSAGLGVAATSPVPCMRHKTSSATRYTTEKAKMIQSQPMITCCNLLAHHGALRQLGWLWFHSFDKRIAKLRAVHEDCRAHASHREKTNEEAPEHHLLTTVALGRSGLAFIFSAGPFGSSRSMTIANGTATTKRMKISNMQVSIARGRPPGTVSCPLLTGAWGWATEASCTSSTFTGATRQRGQRALSLFIPDSRTGIGHRSRSCEFRRLPLLSRPILVARAVRWIGDQASHSRNSSPGAHASRGTARAR